MGDAKASQINGGGCLPPPTPTEWPGEALQRTLRMFFGDNDQKSNAFTKYSSGLPPSLAFRSSTKKMMVEGLGGFIDSDNMRVQLPASPRAAPADTSTPTPHDAPTPFPSCQVPEDPALMGVVLRNGKVCRIDRPRKSGGSMWQTSSDAATSYHREPTSESLEL